MEFSGLKCPDAAAQSLGEAAHHSVEFVSRPLQRKLTISD